MDEWSRFWRTGALHSCAGGHDLNYAGPIAEFWIKSFAKLDPGAHLVDIGTGNGAIPLLASDYSRAHKMNLAISGVDAADIDPIKDATHPGLDYSGITFYKRTAAEALPFSSRSIDMVTSQYAIEYAELAAAVTEVARVLKRGGHIAFVMHAASSAIAYAAAAQSRSAEFLLHQSGFIKDWTDLMTAISEASLNNQAEGLAQDARAQQLRSAFNASSGIISERIASVGAAEAQLLRFTLGRAADSLKLARTLPPNEMLTHILSTVDDIHAENARASRLVQIAMDDVSKQHLLESLQKSGFNDIQIDPLFDSNTVLLGIAVTASLGDADMATPQ